MDYTGFAAALRHTMKEAKSQGIETVKIDGLLAHIDALEKAITEQGGTKPELTPERLAELDRLWQLHLEAHKADLAAKYDSAARMFESVISTAQSANRTMFTMNGAAAVAILAFLGHLAQIRSPMLAEFAWPLTLFTGGVALAGLVSGLSHLIQSVFSTAGSWRFGEPLGRTFNVLAIVVWLSALGAFLWGLWATRLLFLNFVLP